MRLHVFEAVFLYAFGERTAALFDPILVILELEVLRGIRPYALGDIDQRIDKALALAGRLQDGLA